MATTNCCDVFREHYKELCRILSIDDTVLASFTVALYTKKIVNMKTKSHVLRTKGFEGADALLSHVMLKLQSNPKRFRIVLEVLLAEDALSDVGRKMESLNSSEDSLTTHNRRIPNVEAPPTDAVQFAKQLKPVYEELVDVIYDSVKAVDVGKLRVRLNVFFMSDDDGLYPDNHALLCKLDSCKTAEDVLLCLIRAEFIGYLNYKLLEVFAKSSSSEQALKSVEDYEKEYLKLFKCDFPSLIKVFRNPRLTAIPPVSLPEFTIRLGTADGQSNLYTFKKFFENRFSWAEHLLIFDVVENCILIKYGVLPFFVSAVVRDLTDPAIIEELQKEDITLELSPQLMDVATREHHQVLPSPLICSTISSSDVTLFLKSHDLAITNKQKSLLLQKTTTIYTQHTKDDDVKSLDESQVGTVVSEDNNESLSEAVIELEDLPMKKLIDDWDKHEERNSSSGFDEESLDLDIKEDASLAEKVFIYEKALKQLLEEQKKKDTQNEMYKRMMIELNTLQETNAKLKAKLNQDLEGEVSLNTQVVILRRKNEALLEENKLLKKDRSHSQTDTSERTTLDCYEFQSKTGTEESPAVYSQIVAYPPTMGSMYEQLKDLEDWEGLARHIPGITGKVVQTIKEEWPSSLYRQKVDFFLHWLSRRRDLSWNDVLETLVKAGEYSLAVKVDSEFPYKYNKQKNLTPFVISTLLRGLVRWEEFAGLLPHVHVLCIEDIKEAHSSFHDRMVALFQYWLSTYPSASLNDITNALHTLGEHELAQKVQYCLQSPLILYHELKGLNNWEEFAVYLRGGITSRDIEHIKSRCNDLQSRKLALCHTWLSVHPYPSVEDVIYALEGAGELELANDLKHSIEIVVL